MIITKVDQIKETTKKTKYRYKNIDFLLNFNKDNTFLICMFHGGRCGASIPIFRGRDYFIKNCSILSISDPSLEYYKDINIGWYLDTEKYKITENVLKIINYIKRFNKKVLLVSQCSGSLFALKLGCILKENVFVTNHHLVLKSKEYSYLLWNGEKQNYMAYGKKLRALSKALLDSDNNLDNNEELDGRNMFKLYGYPKKIYAYTHKDDYTAKMGDLISNFLIKNHPENDYKFIQHNTPCKSPHHCPLPNNARLLTYIKQIIEEL